VNVRQTGYRQTNPDQEAVMADEVKELHGAQPVVADSDVKAVEEAKKLAAEDHETIEEISKTPVPLGINGMVGDVPETQVTNTMTRLPGFPAKIESEDGELVDIVRKESYGTGGRQKLIDHQGNEWENRDAAGILVPWEDERGTYNVKVKETSSKKEAPKQTAAA
jgi:hypothetical protein